MLAEPQIIIPVFALASKVDEIEQRLMSKLNTGVKDFVLIGNLTRLPQCAVVFPRIEEIYGVTFHIPAHAEFCTALGAALAFEKQN